MNKANFSGAYQNNNNLLKTIKFYQYFKKLLTQKLIDEFHLIEVNAPYVEKFNNDNKRAINFDNLQSNKIFQIVDDCTGYFHSLIKKLNYHDERINGLISLYTQYYRDCQINATNFIAMQIIHLMIKIKYNENFDECINIKINEIAQIIIDIIHTTISYEKINNYNEKFLIKSFFTKNIQNFLNESKTLKLDDFIQEEVFVNKSVLFTNTKQNNSFSKLLNDFSNVKNILEDAQWFIFNEQSNTIVNIIEFMVIKDQNSNNKYLHIKINLDRLIMLILKKSHLAEVIHGIWDDNLEKEALNKKLEIF